MITTIATKETTSSGKEDVKQQLLQYYQVNYAANNNLHNHH